MGDNNHPVTDLELNISLHSQLANTNDINTIQKYMWIFIDTGG